MLDKIDESAKRNNLSAYRQILYEEFESKNCFYCGRPLQPDKIDVDHFTLGHLSKMITFGIWFFPVRPVTGRKMTDYRMESF